LPPTCPSPACEGCIEAYEISFAKDSINIQGACQWDSLDFRHLQRILFREKFEEIELRRSSRLKALNNVLPGKWYPELSESIFKKGERIAFRKSKENSKCYWQFGPGNTFVNTCKKMMGLAESRDFECELSRDTLILGIGPFYGTEENMNGGIFVVDTFNDSFIRLRHR
jgi:hypothetical protein